MRAISAIGLALIGSVVACNGAIVEPIPEPRPALQPEPEIRNPAPPGTPHDSAPSTTKTLLQTGHEQAPSCRVKLAITDCAKEQGYEVYEHTFANGSVDALGRATYYFGVYQTPSGVATVTDRAANPHNLVLTAYEATHWKVTKAPGSGLERIITSGYEAQKVDVDGSVKVEDYSGPAGSPVCGYSYPYNEQGCDTNKALDKAFNWTNGDAVAQMSGCYLASSFTLDGECLAPPPPPPSDDTPFEAHDFKHDATTSGCQGGKMFVKYSARYQKWVGAELCSAGSYKLYLSETRDGVYAPIADSSGHGQDHCELVNPTFTLGNDDDVTSGSCKTCSVTPWGSWAWPGAVPVYVRSSIGEPFKLESWLEWEDPNGKPMSPHHTSSSYSCGVSIP